MFFYLKNLRAQDAHLAQNPATLPIQPLPEWENKAQFKAWCGESSTEHVFYSLIEGDVPSQRVSQDNPPRLVHGVVADYDAKVDWTNFPAVVQTVFNSPPTTITRTFSGYCRLIWRFEEPIQVVPAIFSSFMEEVASSLRLRQALPGFDEASLRPNQYFELGTNWQELGNVVPAKVIRTCLFRATAATPPESGDLHLPMEVVAKEVETRWPGRWPGNFEVGARGPLFWVADGITREGCQVCPDGMLCFSDRASKGFLTWREILSSRFVDQYVEQKADTLLSQFWFNGKAYYTLNRGEGPPVVIPMEQLRLKLRALGFTKKAKKGKELSELEQAVLTITEEGRVDDVTPVIFSKERVVKYAGRTLLNTSNLRPVQPSGTEWPFLQDWLGQLFGGNGAALDHFYAWLKRFYEAVLYHKESQGQALILAGPVGRGKSLLSNKVIGGLVGGFADASKYLSGGTTFNKALTYVPLWVVDDTVSSTSYSEQRKATEIIKRTVANPRLEAHPKFGDETAVPWTGRIILSLNMDAHSLSVIPTLDSSNRDKLIALLVAESATDVFPDNGALQDTIEQELPGLARWLLDWTPPAYTLAGSRFGVFPYIDEAIASAAYDNSPRAVIVELVEYFAQKARTMNLNKADWHGTLTEFVAQLQDFNNGRNIGMSGNFELVRRGMMGLEEHCKANPHVRPVSSHGNGGGKLWTISLDAQYDLHKLPVDNPAAGVIIGGQ